MTSTTIQGSCQLDYLTQAELFNVSIFFFFDERALLSVKTPHVSLISWELTIQWKFSVANVKRNLIISSFKSFLMNKIWSRSQIPSPKGRKADDKIFLNISVQVVSIYSVLKDENWKFWHGEWLILFLGRPSYFDYFSILRSQTTCGKYFCHVFFPGAVERSKFTFEVHPRTCIYGIRILHSDSIFYTEALHRIYTKLHGRWCPLVL